ncbi:MULTISPECIES: rod shape-determining protein MreC [Acidiphilium]|jgi:rod shape-determining protein MreC|uniref:Cell shape-determining protein MreC n=2 Tax=Acidiphilium TaxID=522 RepID=A5FW95_ACICJ|nr:MULTISPECIES: rod shape-determining protein MreC [Acidiphilium]MBU6356035.1 rod shape-determining protein MreC [Rhodospirillales bacterium]ABQ29877.1 rod shape-determining protein MreC [Acidiphilium cryptum JF-5]EGO95413.1 Rod shape-determining protein MreC [Acidiphilium sp. PM]KDM68251.1 cell shape-determining protein MreC [Acidiphilium sp. JA12-A1]MBS3024376.1 rod shape-determining protein MreC [Acidiphilium multivorum]
MLRLSMPVRTALSRLTLPVMLMMSLALVLAGRADRRLGVFLRTQVDDALAPLYRAAAAPVRAVETDRGAVGTWFDLRARNAALRVQNHELRRWRAVALALEAQNEALKSQLHYVPTPTPSFFTARVIADLGGLYARSVMVTLPRHPGDVRDAVAMDGAGVVGRVIEAGSRSARVLLITDLNSKVPVAIGRDGERAIMVGQNTASPRLLYWTPGKPPREGAIVLTSAVGGIFPNGLPVGIVHYAGRNDPEVVPFARLDSLRVLRIFEYGTGGSTDVASNATIAKAR